MKTLTSDEAAAQVADLPDGPQTAERRDLMRRVMTILEGFSENQQEVIRLKFQAGLSYREISRVTALSAGNVGYLIHTAIHKIRDQLAVENEGTVS